MHSSCEIEDFVETCIFACCVWYSNRGYYRLCYTIKIHCLCRRSDSVCSQADLCPTKTRGWSQSKGDFSSCEYAAKKMKKTTFCSNTSRETDTVFPRMNRAQTDRAKQDGNLESVLILLSSRHVNPHPIRIVCHVNQVGRWGVDSFDLQPLE